MPSRFNSTLSPDQRVYVSFDYEIPMMVERQFNFSRESKFIGLPHIKENASNDTIYVEGLGWILKSLGFENSDLQASSTTQAFYLTEDDLTLADKLVSRKSHSLATLSGVSYSGLSSTGSHGFEKRVESGSSWESRLPSDEAAFPQPFPSEDGTDMDRVAVSNEYFEPDDAITFRFAVPGSITDTPKALATFYFGGPPALESDFTGLGYYAIKFLGSGVAKLYERSTSETWKLRKTFRFAHEGSIAGRQHWVHITTNARKTADNLWKGNKIAISFAQTKIIPEEFRGTLGAGLYFVANYITTTMQLARINDAVYEVPRNTNEATTINQKLRVDLRRDVRSWMSIAQLKYPGSGILRDGVFKIPENVTDDTQNIFIELYAYRPAGTNLEIVLKTASGITCSGTVIVDDEVGLVTEFVPEAGHNEYYVQVLYTSDTFKTPVVTSLRVVKNFSVEDYPGVPTEYPLAREDGNLESVIVSEGAVTGPDTQPMSETAMITIHDPGGSLRSSIGQRAGMPIRIEVENGEVRTKIFQGFVRTTAGNRRGSNPDKLYGGADFYSYSYECIGEWQRLSEQLCPLRHTWYSAEVEAPMKVTDILRILFHSAGYPDSMLDIPDISIRLFPSNDSEYVIEPGTPIAPIIVEMAKNYLGAYIFFDPNAGTYGKWRVLQQKRPPYNNLAKFYISHPGDGKVPMPGAYGTSTEGDQTLQHSFVMKGTLTEVIEPPEGNIVIVTGGMEVEKAQAAENNPAAEIPPLLKQIAINTRSFNFLKLDPEHDNFPDVNHPDFLGRIVPIEVYDASLVTQEAVNWMTRRIFDTSCFSRKHVSFDSSLILVTDSEDTVNTDPRPLRFYDPVLLETTPGNFEQFLVLSANPYWKKAYNMKVRYELVRPSNIDELAAP